MVAADELELVRGGRVERYGPGDWYHLTPEEPHAARFAVATAEIECWFDPR